MSTGCQYSVAACLFNTFHDEIMYYTMVAKKDPTDSQSGSGRKPY